MTRRHIAHDKFLKFYAATQKPKQRVRLCGNLSQVIQKTLRILNSLKTTK